MFHSSLRVHFRSRFSQQDPTEINRRIVLGEEDDDGVGDDPSPEASAAPQDETSVPEPAPVPSDGGRDVPGGKRGKLLVDATRTSADITYPTELKLHGEARGKTEHIIEVHLAAV